ncbi:MAG: sensor histidine kinase [Meiothermus sp.]
MRRHWTINLGAVAGLVTWAAVGIPLVVGFFSKPSGDRELVQLGAFLLFGLNFALVMFGGFRRLKPPYETLILPLQVVLATLAFLAHPSYDFLAVLFIINATHAANLWPPRWSLALVAAQALVIFAGELQNHNGMLWAVVLTTVYTGFQLFAFITTEIAERELRAKQELAKLNAELKATQALLAESSRVGERVRIARELHDLIGHQLTALSLNLEVAAHTEGEKSKAHVGKAQAIAKDLLADVRGVVSAMREGNVNLEAALKALVGGVPKPAIHLSLALGLSLEEPEKAHTLVRCVQEIITNTVRHAGASNLWISIENTAQGVVIHAKDDGRGSRDIKAGNGLIGMRERLEGFGGHLDFRSKPGEGFVLDAMLPV